MPDNNFHTAQFREILERFTADGRITFCLSTAEADFIAAVDKMLDDIDEAHGWETIEAAERASSN